MINRSGKFTKQRAKYKGKLPEDSQWVVVVLKVIGIGEREKIIGKSYWMRGGIYRNTNNTNY